MDGERQKFRDFAETSSDWFWETDASLKIKEVSGGFSKATGIATEDFTNQSLGELEPSDQHAHLTGDWRALLDGRLDLRNMYVMMKSPARGQIYLRLAGRAVRSATGEFIGYRGTSADITAGLVRVRAAHRGQKLQALGTMAAGLAHDFNNILAIVLGYTESLRGSLRANRDAVEQLEQIADAGRRGTRLSKSLLSFGRTSHSHANEIFNVRSLAVELPHLLKPVLGAGHALNVHAQDLPLWVNGDRDLLFQTIVSLTINARDAMPGGGSIVLSMGIEPPGSARLRNSRFAEGAQVVSIAVADAGEGMDPETARKAFDPAIIAKNVGQDTGVALSPLVSFVKNHQCHVEIESEPNKGTTFVILLPLSAPPVVRAISRSNPASSDFTGLRVLLVDDEPQLVAIFEKMLCGMGFDVSPHTDVNAALELLDDEREKFDLVVSDVLMPQMSGFRFAELAKALRPAIDVLFVTGQPERGGDGADAVPENAKLLRKPFDKHQLSTALGELLAAKAAA